MSAEAAQGSPAPRELRAIAPRALRAIAIVPARIASQRLARKMLLAETGRPLFEHTVQNVAASGVFARVVVATDSTEIVERARSAGIDAVMTRDDHPSGTDRVHEAWTLLAERADVVVGVQGDEPELDREDLARLVRAFDDREVEIATLAVAFADEAAADLPHTVKVVCDRRGDALYFSRARIPARGHTRLEGEPTDATDALRRHVGVYAFTPPALARFCALPRGTLEAVENLEQLRWLEAGSRIRVVEARRAPLSIDTRADYDRFVARTRASAGSAGIAERAGDERARGAAASGQVRREKAQAG